MSTGRDINKLPSMVKWFTPQLLVRAAFHDIVAHLFGQYADQRVTQHLSDPIPDDADQQKQFAERYDYSGDVNGEEPFWADFVADLGDGFESTYAVAYMLAAGQFDGAWGSDFEGIQGSKELAAIPDFGQGRIVIMGGDEVYPWPSREEYDNRLCAPYELAMPPLPPDPATGRIPDATRDLFAIPGNHDWYDGLASFDDLFCRARSGHSGRESKRMGALQTRQHRSYFALKLPHNWWIWGADIQLSKYLDSGQLEYFRTVSEQMGSQDKFILCTAQPSWSYFGTSNEKYARENLRNLIDMPLRRGAKLCAIFSGDTHHYNRYNESEKLGNFNLFTAGGGGAYTHGTHHLKSEINFDWVGQEVSFKLNKLLKPGTPASDGEPTSRQTTRPACYPSKLASRRLVMGNIVFPFRNKTFCFAIGLIYWMLTWTFSQIRTNFSLATPDAFQLRDGVDLAVGPNIVLGQEKIGIWTLVMIDVFREQYEAADPQLWEALWAALVLLGHGISLLMLGMANSPLASVFLLGTWYVFYAIADTKRVGRGRWQNKLALGSIHFFANLIAMWVLFCGLVYINHTFLNEIFDRWSGPDGFLLLLPKDLWPNLVYPVEMVPLGGLIGGLIFGLYLLITHLLAKIHSDWAFSSRPILRYKNFLRMRFEPDKLTIYPIGLNWVPSRRGGWLSKRLSGWRWVNNPAPGRPKVEPRRPLKPHLIEGPIIIRASEVRNFPRD